MAAEAGHAPNRSYVAQDGSIHLNGAALYDANENDVSASLRNAGGSFINSSNGVNSVATGLSQILGGSACVLTTSALSTAAGVPFFCTVNFSTANGTLKVVAHKPTSTANFGDQIATSTGFSIGWTAFGV